MSYRPRLHTQSAIAAETGWDRRTVAARCARVLPAGKVGRYDGWYLKDLLATQKDDVAPDLNELKKRKIQAETEMREYELAKLRGDLVPKKEALDFVDRKMTAINQILRTIPGIGAPAMVGIEDPYEAQRRLERLIWDALYRGGLTNERLEERRR